MTASAANGGDWIRDVLDFWFGLPSERWWNADPQLDEEVRERFLDLWREKRSLPASSFLGSPEEALAAVVLFDQFPRNMFRGHADQFSTDPLALTVARTAVDRQLDERLSKIQRSILYMPFQHSEDMADQRRSMLLFTELDDDYLLGFAKKHRDIVERFGRFPHRNAILGRAPRPEEEAAGEVVPW